MNEKITNFRQLDIWKLGMEIVFGIYRMIQKFPREEIYGLTSQMRRSAISIPSNIAEGFNRFHTKEYSHFLYIALGSCAELETQIEIAWRLEYLLAGQKDSVLEKVDHESRMLTNLIKKLR